MSNLRKEAKGRGCRAEIPNHCNYDRETTVLAHPNKKSLFNAGMGLKPPDEYGAWVCSSCHDVVDGRQTTEWTDTQVLVWFYEAVFLTQQVLRDEGKL